MTKGSPAGVQHAPGTGLTYCRQCKPGSCSGRTALSRGPLTPCSRSTSHRMPGRTQPNAFSKSTKHMWTGWTNSPAESIELVQCSTARTKNALLLLDLRFDYHLISPLPSSSNRLSQGGWGVWSPDSWKHTLWSPFFWIEGPPPQSACPEATRCCRAMSTKTAPQHSETWGTQGGSSTEELLNYLSDFGLSDEWIPSTAQQYPQSRSTAPHLHFKQCWWRTASPSWGARWFARIKEM